MNDAAFGVDSKLSAVQSQYSLLLASHSLRSISRGNITSSLNSKSVILDFVYSGSR